MYGSGKSVEQRCTTDNPLFRVESLIRADFGTGESRLVPLPKETVLIMAIPATQMRPGMIIKHNNDLHGVFSVEHRTPGNLRAFIQAKLRNLRTGAMYEHRFRSADAIERINVDEVQMEYLYNDGDDYYFMNTENYEQTHLTRDTL